MPIELPRLVKKPGAYKRVDTVEELNAALKDGWVLRLPAPAADASADASDTEPPPVTVVIGGPDLHNPQADAEPESDASIEDLNAEDDHAEPGTEKRKRGRPRGDSAKKK